MRSRIRVFVTCFACLLIPSLVFGSTIVSGKLVMPNGVGGSPGYAQFDLVNCGGNFPTVNGVSVAPQQRFNLNSDGTWSGTLVRNDEVLCNGSTSTWWRFSYYRNGLQTGPARDIKINATNCLLFCSVDGITPLTIYPIISAPTGDNTYLRLDQGNWTTGLLPGLAFTGLPFLNLDKFAKGDAIYFNAACSFTSGSYAVTCSGASFGSGDVGKLVVLFGARGNGSGATATTTLSSGAITIPIITAAGMGYVTSPTAAVSGLTCTYNPELKVNLSGSNYLTGNTVSSITVVYGGSGCTGTPSITVSSGPNLALAGAIASITNSTTVVLATNVAPSITASNQSMLYGTDDTNNLNSAIQALAPDSDTGLNPVGLWCGKLFMTSGTVNFNNKSVLLMSPGPANLSGTNSQQGCGFYLVNQNYSSPTDVVYISGAQMSTFRGMHLYSVSGNKQRAGIRLQQSPSQTHNTQFNRFDDNILGPWYTGGINGGDPETASCFTSTTVLNQCAQFQWGIMLDSPTGYPNTGGANNDQMLFSNNLVIGADIGMYVFSNQSAELTLDRFMCDGCNIGIQSQANLSCRECDISNSRTADIQIGDALYSGNNGLLRLDLENFTSEGSHQFLIGGSNSSFNNIDLFFHGQISWQASASTIQSGTIIDLAPLIGGGNVSVTSDNGLTVLGVLPAKTAPLNYRWYSGPGYAQGPNYVQNMTNIAFNVPEPPLNQWGNLQLTYPDYRQSQLFRRDWLVGTARCHTDQIFFGGSPDNIECNNTTNIGKQRVFGELMVSAIGSPGAPTCTKLSGSGGTTYYYKMAGVVAGIIGPASVETSCGGQAASLSSTAVNQACAVPIAGAQQYAVYESTAAGAEKLLATINADQMIPGASNMLCYNDSAAGASGANPLSTDSTGGAEFAGPVTVHQAAAVSSLNINNDGAMTKNPRVPFTGYLYQTSNASAVTFAQWVNSTPSVMRTLVGIANAASTGCTSPISFWIHDVAQNTDSAAVTIANGAGNTNSLTGQSFQTNAGDTVQMRYTAVGCTSNLFGMNLTAEFEPQ